LLTADVTSTSLSHRAPAISKRVSFSLSKTAYWLFLLFTVYLIVPVIDVPLMGLSLSAPIMFLLFLEVFFSPHSLKLSRFMPWLIFSYAFLFGLLLSLAGNAVFRGLNVGSRDWLILFRFCYWIIAFFTTLLVVSSLEYLKSIGFVIAGGILVVAALRLFEAIIFGRWGAWTAPRIMTQNSYGFQFSSFFPFALALPFVLRG